jgi:streptogramin lyase
VNNFAPHSQPTIPPEAGRSRKLGLFLVILAVMLLVTACDQQSSGSSRSDAEARAKDLPDYVEAEIPVGSKPEMVAAGFGSVWVSVHGEDIVSRIDPKTNKVVTQIKTPYTPCVVETGVGSVWLALCEGQGLLRINPETNKIATELDAGGGLAVFGGGSVWTVLDDQPDHPLARIDPQTNKVTEVPLGIAGHYLHPRPRYHRSVPLRQKVSIPFGGYDQQYAPPRAGP